MWMSLDQPLELHRPGKASPTFEELLVAANTNLELLGRIITCLDRTHQSETNKNEAAIAALRSENNELAQALQTGTKMPWPVTARPERFDTDETEETYPPPKESTISTFDEAKEESWPSEWPDGPLEFIQAPDEYEDHNSVQKRMQAITRGPVTGRGYSPRSATDLLPHSQADVGATTVDIDQSQPQASDSQTMDDVNSANEVAESQEDEEESAYEETVRGPKTARFEEEPEYDENRKRSGGASMISYMTSDVAMYTNVELWPVWENVKMRRRPRRTQSNFRGALNKSRSKHLGSGSSVDISPLKQLSRAISTGFGGALQQSKSSNSTTSAEQKPQTPYEKCSKNIVASPMSSRRLLWDLAGMTLIGYDLIVIPLQTFDPPANKFTDTMGWITTLFWTIDIVFSFLVGYHSDGIVEMRMSRIAQRYLRTWFVFDIVVIFIDWTATVMNTLEDSKSAAAAGDVGFLRFGKSVRFLRMLRLLRLVKVHGMLADILEHVQSEFFRIILGIVKLIVLIVLANHVIACGFFWIGTIDDDYVFTWVTSKDRDGQTLMDRDIPYRYFTSLHWSLTQFTPASMEIVPRNALERAYTACIILLAMITFSSFISSLTNAMTQLRNLNSDKIAQHSVLRRYLKQNTVGTELSARIWVSVQAKKQTRRLHEKDVTILEALPSTLQVELRDHIFLPKLTAHPFFFQFLTYHRKPMRKVHKCLTELFVGLGKELFQGAEDAKCMYFIFQGRLAYNTDHRISTKQDTLKLDSGTLQWLVEPVLWIRWKHCGQMVGMSHCELLALDAEGFQQILPSDSPEAGSAARYAKAFATHAKAYPTLINDVWADFDTLQELAQCAFMEHEEDFAEAPSTRSRQQEAPSSELAISTNAFG